MAPAFRTRFALPLSVGIHNYRKAGTMPCITARSQPLMLRGTVSTFRRRSGKPTCRCAEGEPHESPALVFTEDGAPRPSLCVRARSLRSWPRSRHTAPPRPKSSGTPMWGSRPSANAAPMLGAGGPDEHPARAAPCRRDRRVRRVTPPVRDRCGLAGLGRCRAPRARRTGKQT